MKHILTVCHIIFVAWLFTLQPAPVEACSIVSQYIEWPKYGATAVPTNSYLVASVDNVGSLTVADINTTLIDATGNSYSLTPTIADEFFGENIISFLPTAGDLPANTDFTFTLAIGETDNPSEVTFTTASGADELAPVIQDATVSELIHTEGGLSSCGSFDSHIRLSIDVTYAADTFNNTFLVYSNSDPDDAEYDWTGTKTFYVDDFESTVTLMQQARDYSGNESDVYLAEIDLTPVDTTQESTLVVDEEFSLIGELCLSGESGCGGGGGGDDDDGGDNADGTASCSLSVNANPNSFGYLVAMFSIFFVMIRIVRKTI